jgi:hypothetical protein
MRSILRLLQVVLHPISCLDPHLLYVLQIFVAGSK